MENKKAMSRSLSTNPGKMEVLPLSPIIIKFKDNKDKNKDMLIMDKKIVSN